LLAACRAVLAPDARFIVLTAYAIQASALIPYQALQEVVGSQGNLTCGELVTIEESANHVLSHALFARWTP